MNTREAFKMITVIMVLRLLHCLGRLEAYVCVFELAEELNRECESIDCYHQLPRCPR